MRVRLNRSLKTKPKKQDNASRHNKEKKTNKETKNTMEPDNTELIIQITFAAAMVAANLLTFYALHIAALIILFKCITNFPKERNQKNTRGRHPPYSKTTKSERRMRDWKRRRKRRESGWKHTKCVAKLVLTTLLAMNMTDTAGSPRSRNHSRGREQTTITVPR